MPEKTPLEIVQEARADLAEAASKAANAEQSATELSDAIEEFRGDTAKRLNPWRMVFITAAGAFVAGFLSLTLFVVGAATCEPGDGGYCKLLAPESAGQEAVVEALVTAQLRGTEFLLDGGSTDAFLSGEGLSTTDIVTVIRPDGDGTWTVLSGDATEDILTETGLDFSSLPAPQEEVFGDSEDNMVALRAAETALATGLPQNVSRLISESGILFTTRAVPHGPNTVAMFTTITLAE